MNSYLMNVCFKYRHKLAHTHTRTDGQYIHIIYMNTTRPYNYFSWNIDSFLDVIADFDCCSALSFDDQTNKNNKNINSYSKKWSKKNERNVELWFVFFLYTVLCVVCVCVWVTLCVCIICCIWIVCACNVWWW